MVIIRWGTGAVSSKFSGCGLARFINARRSAAYVSRWVLIQSGAFAELPLAAEKTAFAECPQRSRRNGLLRARPSPVLLRKKMRMVIAVIELEDSWQESCKVRRIHCECTTENQSVHVIMGGKWAHDEADETQDSRIPAANTVRLYLCQT